MAQRQLNIRSDEAFGRANALARRLGKTTTEVVIDALRIYDRQNAATDEQGLTIEQRAEFEALCAIARRAAADPSASDLPNDHSWLYDERGLPR